MFKQNYIKFGKTDIPLYDLHDMPMIIPEVVTGEYFSGGGGSRASSVYGNISVGVTVLAEENANWQYVHRILAHTSRGYCERTAKKAMGLPKVLKQPSRPCCECVLGKMKVQRRGQGDLSTGLSVPTRPGEQLNTNIHGPFSVPGVKSEKYFITLFCTFPGWGEVWCMVSKDQAGKMIESMVLEARALGKLQSEADVIIHTSTIHSDNDYVYRSKAYAD